MVRDVAHLILYGEGEHYRAVIVLAEAGGNLLPPLEDFRPKPI